MKDYCATLNLKKCSGSADELAKVIVQYYEKASRDDGQRMRELLRSYGKLKETGKPTPILEYKQRFNSIDRMSALVGMFVCIPLFCLILRIFNFSVAYRPTLQSFPCVAGQILRCSSIFSL
jgi:hypothetical protein